MIAPRHQSTLAEHIVARSTVPADFEKLRTMSRRRLIALGMKAWDESGLLLLPMEWYDRIPRGFKVVSISGRTKAFVPGKTDNDCRFGMLAYGIVKP